MSLTRKQKAVFDFIVDYIREYEVSPTQDEIREHFNFKSLGSVQDYIKYLKNAGYLTSDINSVRGLTPVISNISEKIEIPMHGKVAAGSPIETYESFETIEVPKSMIGKGNYFALTIQGSSMIEDGILDGDIVVIKEQKMAQNGDTVVATIDNEATIKRYYYKKNKVELHPANATMKPIIIGSGDLQIKGVLVGLLRVY
jgi:repressor LexA